MHRKNTDRIIAALSAAALLSAGMILSVPAAGTRAPETEDSGAAETESESLEALMIGEKAGDSDYEVTLVNESGKEITGIALRASYEEYSDNLLPEGSVMKDGQTGTVWCTPAEMLNYVPPVYDMKLTFADESSAVLHTLPFGDADELTILEDEESGTVYVHFFSISLNTETDSLAGEKNIASSGEEGMIADYLARTGQAPAGGQSGDAAGDGGGQAQSAPAPAQESAPAQDQCLTDGLMF